jgi:hypothetical protein
VKKILMVMKMEPVATGSPTSWSWDDAPLGDNFHSAFGEETVANEADEKADEQVAPDEDAFSLHPPHGETTESPMEWDDAIEETVLPPPPQLEPLDPLEPLDTPSGNLFERVRTRLSEMIDPPRPYQGPGCAQGGASLTTCFTRSLLVGAAVLAVVYVLFYSDQNNNKGGRVAPSPSREVCAVCSAQFTSEGK